jgi:hypothetical protein
MTIHPLISWRDTTSGATPEQPTSEHTQPMGELERVVKEFEARGKSNTRAECETETSHRGTPRRVWDSELITTPMSCRQHDRMQLKHQDMAIPTRMYFISHIGSTFQSWQITRMRLELRDQYGDEQDRTVERSSRDGSCPAEKGQSSVAQQVGGPQTTTTRPRTRLQEQGNAPRRL